MNRDEMVTLLRENTCRVQFVKVNGETRDMRCTLQYKLIPDEMRPKGTEIEKTTEASDVIRVFDVNANGWRSFKVDNVKEFEVE